MSAWDYLDVEALLAARAEYLEQTMSGNTGGYTKSFGPVLTRQPSYYVDSPTCHDAEFCVLPHEMWDSQKR